MSHFAGRFALSLTLLVCGVGCGPGPDLEADGAGQADAIVVGSKVFPENVILGEMITQLMQNAGAEVIHERGMGGSQTLWESLRAGEIDAYPEYTGTIQKELFASRNIKDEDELRKLLKSEFQIEMSQPFGLNNTYAIGVRKVPPDGISQADWDKVTNIADLRKYPDLEIAFSNEFLDRNDGWPALKRAFRLPHKNVDGVDHSFAYAGLESGTVDVIDLYSTDPDIQRLDLKILSDELEDGRNFFPNYNAMILYRDDLDVRDPDAVEAMLRLEGQIDNETIIPLNARAKLDKTPEPIVAADYLQETFNVKKTVRRESRTARLTRRTWEHLQLVGISVFAAVIVAVPLGVFAAKAPLLGQVVLGVTGILQTIPSLVLFLIMIPYLGIGPQPVIVGLFLYSLLPIVRNTYAGLAEIPRQIHESAEALGLPPAARLWRVELPLATRSIMAGIKTAATINVGTATLGGLIAAGGYGAPIFTGIRRLDWSLVSEGAIAAAVMALCVQFLFDIAERFLVSPGLRTKRES